MRTKLSVFCDRVLEAGWLLALITAPLFFNIYSSRVFEPDKLAVVRSIALVMIAVWFVKVLDGASLGPVSPASQRPRDAEGTLPRPSLRQRLSSIPLLVPTLLLVGSYLLSTILSIAPRISFWGSYMRLQGTYTTFSYIVIFFLMLGTMRSREQVNRLCGTLILTSLPVSLYGVLQHYRLDSLPWSGDTSMRVASNMGNSIFVAAYLIMAVPITLAKLIESFSTLLKEQDGSIAHALLAGCYTFVLSVQMICIFFSQSRGPWLGLLVGLYVFMLVALISLRRNIADEGRTNMRDVWRALAFALLSIPVGVVPGYIVLAALKRGWRWLWLAWVFHTLLAVAFLVLLNVPRTPLASLRNLPYVGRLGQIYETETGTGKVRVLIWEGVLELITDDPLRTLVGYGPETMHVAYNPFYPPDLAHYEARNASPDRSHNETFDALAITGVLGFVAYMLLFGGIFYYALKWLGFMRTGRQRDLFLLFSIAGAVVGVFVTRLIEGTYRLSGVGLPVGFIAGASLYLMVSAAFFSLGEREVGNPTRQLLLIALFSAIVAHFVEIHFGIAIASTRVHFWAYAALFVLLGLQRIQETAPQPAVEPKPGSVPHMEVEGRQDRRSKRSRRRAKQQGRQTATVEGARGPATSLTARLVAASLIMAVILFTLGFEFIANPMGELDSLRIIQLSLTTLAARGDSTTVSYGVLWMFILTWLVGALVVCAEAEVSGSARQNTGWWLSALGTYAAVTLLVFVFTMPIHASLLKPGSDIANTVTFYFTGIAVIGVLLALSLTADVRLPQRLWRRGNVWAYPILIALAVVVGFATNISIVKADIYYKQGLKLEEGQRWDSAIQFYERAISLAPDQDYYYLFLGRAMMSKAKYSVTEVSEKASLYEKSRDVLEQAAALNPLNTDHQRNLGVLYRDWALYAQTEQEQQERLSTANAYYEQVARLSPNNAQFINEWASVYMDRGDLQGAEEKLNYSLSLDPQFAFTYLLLGNLYASQGRLEEAAQMYQEALALEPTNAEAHSALGYIYFQQGNITDALASNLTAVNLDPSLARAHSTLGLIYFQLGRLEEAVEENLQVLAVFPNDFISHRNLALLYGQMGRIDEAISHAEQALALATETDRPAVQAFIDQLQAQQAASQTEQ